MQACLEPLQPNTETIKKVDAQEFLEIPSSSIGYHNGGFYFLDPPRGVERQKFQPSFLVHLAMFVVSVTDMHDRDLRKRKVRQMDRRQLWLWPWL